MSYQARSIQFRSSTEVAEWLTQMQCDPAGVAIMTPKAQFRTVFVENVPAKAANLLKQTFLAKGGEVAVARGTADLSVDRTNVLICATLKQFFQALSQLRQQPWGLPEIAAAVEKAINNEDSGQGRDYSFGGKIRPIQSEQTLIMGIINLTPDSFSDGGRYNTPETAVERALEMEAEGADFLDLGAESTRPYGSVKISASEEMRRLLPVLEQILKRVKLPVSVDTYKSEVADAALKMGAHIVNDIWGLQQDVHMAEVVAAYGVPVVVMHNRSGSESSRDILSELTDFFVRSEEIALRSGIAKERIVIDPGIGFGKTSAQNLEILGRLSELKSLGYPILVGTSRKRFIGEILGLPADERTDGTSATLVHAIMNGATILRVHDVKTAKRIAKMTDALKGWRQYRHG